MLDKVSITLEEVLSCQGYTMPLLDINIDQAKSVYDVNVWGVLRTTQVFSSLVIKAQGSVVIIGSIAGIMPYVFGGVSSHFFHSTNAKQ
jgi:short-subunit dehydrogenase